MLEKLSWEVALVGVHDDHALEKRQEAIRFGHHVRTLGGRLLVPIVFVE